jgi:hypothetical protein
MRLVFAISERTLDRVKPPRSPVITLPGGLSLILDHERQIVVDGIAHGTGLSR